MANISKLELGGGVYDLVDKSAQTQIESMKTDISSNTTDISSLESDVNTLRDTVDELSQSNDAIQSGISTLESDVSDIENDTSSLKTSMSSIQSSVSSNTTDISSIKSSVNTLNTNMSSVKSDVSSLKTTVNELSQSNSSFDIFESLNQYPAAKNSIIRGKDITEYYEDGSLYTRIANDFDDLFVGDYISATFNNIPVLFIIAGFNVQPNRHYIYKPDSCIENVAQYRVTFVSIIQDKSLNPSFNKPMNETNTVAGGYIHSYMNQTVIGPVATEASTDTINGLLYGTFGDYLLTSYEGGVYYNGSWTLLYAQAILLNEIELFGISPDYGSGDIMCTTTGQLPLFKNTDTYQFFNYYAYLNDFWLRDVSVSGSTFRFFYAKDGRLADSANANYKKCTVFRFGLKNYKG